MHIIFEEGPPLGEGVITTLAPIFSLTGQLDGQLLLLGLSKSTEKLGVGLYMTNKYTHPRLSLIHI